MKFQEIENLFENLYVESEENLNRLVEGDSVIVPESSSDEFNDLLEKFLKASVEFYLENDDISIFEGLSQKENCNEFIEWVVEYINETVQPLKETAFLKDISIGDFKEFATYCYENYVLYDSGKNLLTGNDGKWSLEQIGIMRKVILTIADMHILHFYSRDRVLKYIHKMFRLSDNYGNILIDIINNNEERLWKYLMFNRLEHLESIMERFMEMSSDE